ncbi:MAG: hypothetical protein V4525_03035 [Pseudomonadota bacterium]
MLFLAYAQWSLFDAPWVKYLQRCIARKHWNPHQVFLLIELDDSLGFQGNVEQRVYNEPQLHGLIFQPLHRMLKKRTLRLSSEQRSLQKEFPLFSSLDKISCWEKSNHASCKNQFFLGYHPWFGASDVFEAMGDRWWPTRAWWRGWTWSMNLNNSPATIMVLV